MNFLSGDVLCPNFKSKHQLEADAPETTRLNATLVHELAARSNADGTVAPAATAAAAVAAVTFRSVFWERGRGRD